MKIAIAYIQDTQDIPTTPGVVLMKSEIGWGYVRHDVFIAEFADIAELLTWAQQFYGVQFIEAVLNDDSNTPITMARTLTEPEWRD